MSTSLIIARLLPSSNGDTQSIQVEFLLFLCFTTHSLRLLLLAFRNDNTPFAPD
jgi:hypothetical protein